MKRYTPVMMPKAPTLTAEARDMLGVLHEEARFVVIQNMNLRKETIECNDVEQGIRASVSTIRQAFGLVSTEFLAHVTIESEVSAPRVRRSVNDVIRGIRNCGYCLTLAHELFAIASEETEEQSNADEQRRSSPD